MAGFLTAARLKCSRFSFAALSIRALGEDQKNWETRRFALAGCTSPLTRPLWGWRISRSAPPVRFFPSPFAKETKTGFALRGAAGSLGRGSRGCCNAGRMRRRKPTSAASNRGRGDSSRPGSFPAPLLGPPVSPINRGSEGERPSCAAPLPSPTGLPGPCVFAQGFLAAPCSGGFPLANAQRGRSCSATNGRRRAAKGVPERRSCAEKKSLPLPSSSVKIGAFLLRPRPRGRSGRR